MEDLMVIFLLSLFRFYSQKIELKMREAFYVDKQHHIR
jgi:hypothetical protein